MKMFFVSGRYEGHYCTAIKRGKSKKTLNRRLIKEGWTDFHINNGWNRQ